MGVNELLHDQTGLHALVRAEHGLQPTGGEEDVAGLLYVLQRLQAGLDEGIVDWLVDIGTK